MGNAAEDVERRRILEMGMRMGAGYAVAALAAGGAFVSEEKAVAALRGAAKAAAADEDLERAEVLRSAVLGLQEVRPRDVIRSLAVGWRGAAAQCAEFAALEDDPGRSRLIGLAALAYERCAEQLEEIAR